MNVKEFIEKMKEEFKGYTLSISEQEDFNVVIVRTSAEGEAVSVINNGDISLEETLEEAHDRLQCLISGEEYIVSKKESTENAIKLLKLTLQEMSFDKAVSLVEKLNNVF